MVSQEDIEHVASPATEGAVLVVSHAEVGLALLEGSLNGPAESGGVAELLEGGAFGSVGEGEAQLPLRRFEHDQPFGTEVVLGRLGHTPDPACVKESPDRPLGPLLEDHRREGKGLGQVGNGDGSLGQTRLGRGLPPGALAFGNPPFRSRGQHMKVGPDGGEVRATLGKTREELPVHAEGGVAADPVGRKEAGAIEIPDHLACDLGLGLEGQIFGNAGFLVTFGIVCVLDPFFGEVKLGIEEPLALVADIAHEDAGLAVLDLAEPAAILAGHSGRLFAALDLFRGIERQHRPGRIGFYDDRIGDLGPITGEQGLLVPIVAAHELLEAPNSAGGLNQSQGHRLDALSLDVAAQAGQIRLPQAGEANVAHDVPVPVVKVDQRLDQRLDVLGGEIGGSRGGRSRIGKGGRRGLPVGAVHRDLRLLRFPAHEAHAGAEDRIEHEEKDLLGLAVVSVSGPGLGISRRRTEWQKTRSPVARPPVALGIHEALHHPGADGKPRLPVAPQTGEGRGQDAGGEIFDLDSGKDQEPAVVDHPVEMGRFLLGTPSDPLIPGPELQGRCRKGQNGHRFVSHESEVLEMPTVELADAQVMMGPDETDPKLVLVLVPDRPDDDRPQGLQVPFQSGEFRGFFWSVGLVHGSFSFWQRGGLGRLGPSLSEEKEFVYILILRCRDKRSDAFRTSDEIALC